MRKFWIKLWTEEWLDGSVRFELTPSERGIFIDILALAGRSRNPGVVASNETTPYPKSWLAGKLGVSIESLRIALAKFVAQGRIQETPQGLEIVNWSKYQSPNSPSKKEELPDPRVGEILKKVEEIRGYPSPGYGREGKAIKVMLASHIPEDILGCFEALRKDPFWASKELLMDSVAVQLSKWVASGRNAQQFVRVGKKVIEEPDLGTRIKEF